MFERACRSNSSSTSCNSGEIKSKMRLAVNSTSSAYAVCPAVCMCLIRLDYGPVRQWRAGQVRRLNENILLVASIIRELHIDSEVFRFETRNHLLQSIAIAPGHAEHIPLNRGLNLSLRILNVLHNILRFFLWDALLDLHALTDCASGRSVDVAVAQSFQGHTTPHEFLLQNLVHVAQFGLVFSQKHQFLFFQGDIGMTSFKVESLTHFFHGLVNCVHYFSAINLRDDVE